MRAHKVDSTQAAIVKALRKAGCSVWVNSSTGDGTPDLCVGFRHLNYFLEVKRDHKAALTPDQKKFRDTWRGHYAVVTNVDEAMIAVGLAK